MGKDETVSSYAGMFEIGQCLSYSELWTLCKLKHFYFILGKKKVNKMTIFCFFSGEKKGK